MRCPKCRKPMFDVFSIERVGPPAMDPEHPLIQVDGGNLFYVCPHCGTRTRTVLTKGELEQLKIL